MPLYAYSSVPAILWSNTCKLKAINEDVASSDNVTILGHVVDRKVCIYSFHCSSNPGDNLVWASVHNSLSRDIPRLRKYTFVRAPQYVHTEVVGEEEPLFFPYFLFELNGIARAMKE